MPGEGATTAPAAMIRVRVLAWRIVRILGRGLPTRGHAMTLGSARDALARGTEFEYQVLLRRPYRIFRLNCTRLIASAAAFVNHTGGRPSSTP